MGPLHLQLGQYVDGLTAVMLVVVTSVSLCVHVYSLGYMDGDVRYTWFYVVLSLFTGAMLNVVVADNLFQLLVGWEVMGVCSYLLIGHWYEDKENSERRHQGVHHDPVGDVPFMFGIFALVFATGVTTSNIQVIGQTVAEGGARLEPPDHGRGAAAVRRHDRQVGPVPAVRLAARRHGRPDAGVALIHAATMVAAGVYLVARMFAVFVHADPIVLTVVGAIGAHHAADGGAARADPGRHQEGARVLRRSPSSRTWSPALGLGEAGYAAGMFHLFTHAFFKALLFLGAGSVIHAVHTNDMSEMGGLRKHMPVTFVTFLIGSLALAGIAAARRLLVEGRDHLAARSTDGDTALAVRSCSLVDGGPHGLLHRRGWCS